MRKEGKSPDEISRHFLIATSTLYLMLSRQGMRKTWKESRVRVIDSEQRLLRKCIRLHALGHTMSDIIADTGKSRTWLYENMNKMGYTFEFKNYNSLTNDDLYSLIYVEKMNYTEIGKLYGVSRRTVSALARRYEFETELAGKRRERRKHRGIENNRA